MSAETSKPHTQLPLAENGVNTSTKPHSSPALRRTRFYLVPLFMLTMFTGAVIGMYFQPPALRLFFNATGLKPGAGTQTPIALAIQKVTSQEEIAVVSEGDVVALGRIIPRGDVMRVATPSGAGDARIADIRVTEGAQVNSGDILAVLDNLGQLENSIASARANIGVREAVLVQTQATTMASRDEAKAAVERSKATYAAAQSDLVRSTSLFERGVLTRADFDQVVTRASEAGRDVERNIATLSRFETGSELVQADIAVAQANLDAARIELVKAEQDVERAYVRAPQTATVLGVNARVGERPSSSGIFDLGDTTRMTVEAEVYQTMIGRVSIGDPVIVSAEALDEDLTGVVTAIGLEIGRQSITSSDPAANTDGRVVDVIIALDASSSQKAKRFTNLQAVVRIDAGRIE